MIFNGPDLAASAPFDEAAVLASFAGIAFATGQLTLRYDRDPERRTGAVRHAVRAADALKVIVAELLLPEVAA